MKNYADVLEIDDFNYHINRYLSQLDEKSLIVTDGTSYAYDFPDVIKALKNVHLIILSATNEVNGNLTTLQFEFILPSGKLFFQAHWTAYKDIRADELVESLSVLKRQSLLKYLVYKDRVGLVKVPYVLSEILKIVFQIIGDDKKYGEEKYKEWSARFGRVYK